VLGAICHFPIINVYGVEVGEIHKEEAKGCFILLQYLFYLVKGGAKEDDVLFCK